MKGAWIGGLLFVLGVAGCSVGLEHGLEEQQANEVLAALERSGIMADKMRDDAQGKWKVMVARAELGRAVTVLERQALPRRAEQGISEAFARPGLIPSILAERARLQASLAVDLSRTLETLPGVVGARVHLNLASDDPLRDDASHTRSTASVVLRLTPGPAPSDAEVRRLIAGGVSGMQAADIEVLRSIASSDGQAPTLVMVGPFKVAAESRTLLHGFIVATIFLLVGLALVALVLGGRFFELRRRWRAKK